MSRFFRLLSLPHPRLTWMEKLWLSALVLAILMAPYLSHAMKIPGKDPNCSYSQTAQVSLNYSDSGNDINILEKKLEEKLAIFEEKAKKSGITKLNLTSFNSSFSQQSVSSYVGIKSDITIPVFYQASANASYDIIPYDKAKDFIVSIADLNMQSSLSLNLNRDNCP